MSKANNITEQLDAAERTLDRELSKYSIFLQAERKSGIKKTHLVVGAGFAVLSFIFLQLLPTLTLTLIATVYPALMTVAAIEHHNKQEDTRWLTYWLVLGAMAFIHLITGGALERVVPLFNVIKAAFLVWLFLPSTRGATLIYEHAFRPLVKQPGVKEALGKLQKGLDANVKSAEKIVQDAKIAASKLNSDVKAKVEKVAETVNAKLATEAKDD